MSELSNFPVAATISEFIVLVGTFFCPFGVSEDFFPIEADNSSRIDLKIANQSSVGGNPAILGPSGSLGRLLGGSEDPRLCVSGFRQICLLRETYLPMAGILVNSEMYILSGKS